MSEDPTTQAHPLGEVLENMLAPEAYATEASFFALANGNVTVTFTSTRWDNATTPPSKRRVVVGRVVMPAAAAQGLAVGLFDFLKASGLEFTFEKNAIRQ